MKRDKIIDLIKGFAILLMVFDHVGFGNNIVIHTYIQSFHMPLFFLVSGYLYRDYKTIDRIKNKSKKLLIPYFLYSFFYLIIKTIILKKGNFLIGLKTILFFPTDMDNFPLNPPLWFLMVMFLTDILFKTLYINSKNRKISLIILVPLCLLGMKNPLINKILPFGINTIFSSLIFMIIGYNVKNVFLKSKIYNKIKHQFEKKWKLNVALFVLIIINLIFIYKNKSVDMRSARYNNIFLYIFNGGLGTFIWYLIYKNNKINNKFTNYFANILEYCSLNSINFLCVNFFFFLIISKLLNPINDFYLKYFISFILDVIGCILWSIILKKIKQITNQILIKKEEIN